jgi:hypothetical protein
VVQEKPFLNEKAFLILSTDGKSISGSLPA